MLDTPPPRSVVPARYIQALDGADPIDTQRKAPKRLKKLLKGLSEKQLSRRPAPEKWSIKEIVAHLADGEVIMGARIRFVAAQDRPPLPGYDQDLFVQNLGVHRVKTKDLLHAFAMARKLNVQLLERLPESALDRTGLHAERGEESIRTMITMYAGHDIIHEEQVKLAREALRNGNVIELEPAARNGKRAKDDETVGKKSGKKAARKAAKKAEKRSRKQSESMSRLTL
jgi:hypothetical protein